MEIFDPLRSKRDKEFTFEERIRQHLLLLSANDGFLADIKNIQKKYNLPAPEEKCDWEGLPLVLDDKNFINDSEVLRKKYNLPISHELALSVIIQGGELTSSNFGASLWHLNPNCNLVRKNKSDCIILEIYPDTTLKDIQENWPRIKRAKDRLLKLPIERKNRSENLERDIEILKLKRNGKTIKEIAAAINADERFNKEIVAYEEIPKIIKRLKDKASKLLPPKET